MVSVLLSRVIGQLREMVIAYAGSAGQDVDSYQVAFVIPEILNHIVAIDFLSVTFIPIFPDSCDGEKRKMAGKFFPLF